ncbi:MAG: hypothetical protein ACK5PP_09340 [Acidimicrobiales bacterium]
MTVPDQPAVRIRHAMVAGLVVVNLVLLTLILFKNQLGPFGGPS